MQERTVEALEAELAALKAHEGTSGHPEAAPAVISAVAPVLEADPEPVLPPTPRPAQDVWGSNEYDFMCPSGAQCRMRKIQIERLIEDGILDKITALPGYAADVVEKAEAVGPPKKAEDEMPTQQEFDALIDVLNILVPQVVAQPEVWRTPPKGEERVNGRIYVDSIDLEDRVAIMERALEGTRGLVRFRK